MAGYLTLRISLYRALDAELVETATSLAVVPVARDIRTLRGSPNRAGQAERGGNPHRRRDLRAGRADHLVLGAEERRRSTGRVSLGAVRCDDR